MVGPRDEVNFLGHGCVDTHCALRWNPIAARGAGHGAAWRHDWAAELANTDDVAPLTWLESGFGPAPEPRIILVTKLRRPQPSPSTAGVGEARPVTIVVTVATIAVGVAAAVVVGGGRRRGSASP